jgi:hypothetical protein
MASELVADGVTLRRGESRGRSNVERWARRLLQSRRVA